MPLGKTKQHHSQIVVKNRIKQQPLQIQSCNVGLACYCWAVEGGRDVHFQLCGLCQASHHSLKDVTQRFLASAKKYWAGKKKRWRDDGARS